jgi:hypothetical protein
MLKEANKAIGNYALQLTYREMFGMGSAPCFIKAAKNLLFSYALSKAEHLTADQIKDINKRILDLTL